MKFYQYFLFSLVLSTVCFSCNEDPTFDDASTTPSIAVDTENNSSNVEGEYMILLELVNELRASGCQCGNEFKPPVGSLSWNNQLAQAALRHSQDMKLNEHFSHTGTDGSNPGQRITATGYNWRTYGENIALRFFTAQSVFNGWRNSPGHCNNMMNVGFTEMGAARVAEYYTQNFGAQR